MTNILKKKIIPAIMTLLIATEIFYFSSLSFGNGSGGNSWLPIIYHFSVFFLLTFFLFKTIYKKEKSQIKQILIVLIISISYAISDEIHQLFVPFRSANIEDLMVDSLGILFSIIISLKMDKSIKKVNTEIVKKIN